MKQDKDQCSSIQLASKIPPASVGSIEVRPIRAIRENARAHAAKATG
jgi:hypothetical protein